jgi:hypothetical protein
MTKLPNKLVIFGAVAAAALAVPGVLGPLMFEDAYATHRSRAELSNDQTNQAENVLAQANVGVNANVDVNDVTACVIVGTCTG